MKVLVLYFSKGGNTRKLAEAIAQGVEDVEGVECVMKKTDEVTKDDFVQAQGIIAGSPVYFGVGGQGDNHDVHHPGTSHLRHGNNRRSHGCHRPLWHCLRGGA